MRTKPRTTKSRWLAILMVCVVAASSCDGESNGVNTLSISAAGYANDSAVAHARVTFPGFDRTYVDYGRSGPVIIPIAPRSGAIHLQFARIKGQSDTIGKGEVSLPIKRGNVYGASFTRLPAKMIVGCFGCTGELKFPMMGSASASTDSMHLSYTNSPPLCKGCVAERKDASKAIVSVARMQ